MKLPIKELQLALFASLVLVISACNNKETEMKEIMQSKLEKCFTKAEINSLQDTETQWKNDKCDLFDTLTRDERLQCGDLIRLRKNEQSEAEEQCMKLYKN